MPSAGTAALAELCPDLENWPNTWRYQQSDIALGERIAECFKAFTLHLLNRGLATKTLQRHRDHLWMLGGEIIRRAQQEPKVARKPAKRLLLEFVDDDCGPLIWPRISEQQQNSFDATCRKLYQFLITSSRPSGQHR
jgi:hypothetical protein